MWATSDTGLTRKLKLILRLIHLKLAKYESKFNAKCLFLCLPLKQAVRITIFLAIFAAPVVIITSLVA